MAKIEKFVYVMIIFIFLFLVVTNVEGKKIPFQIFFFNSQTIFYPILVTLFNYIFSLQEEKQGNIDVLEIQIVQNVYVEVL